jgi:hypothetical protein
MRKKQDSTSAGSGACLQREGRSGRRHWFRVTGLPGWKRAQLGMPAFGEADCTTTNTDITIIPIRLTMPSATESKAKPPNESPRQAEDIEQR